jgi:LysM repeat protein
MLLAAASLTLLLAPALTASASDQHVRIEVVRMQAPQPGASYTVLDGDSLYSMAADLGIPDGKVAAWVEEFLALNDMEDADHLTAGQTVKIPGTPRTASSSTSSSTPTLTQTSGSSAGGSRPYTVQNGDTLYGIASNLNVPGDKLYEWVQATLDLNEMDGGDSLTVGKTIQVSTKNVPVPKPITSSYIVKPGDTLYDIAAKQNVPDSGYTGWAALVLELNGLSSPDVLRDGQTLQLPVTSGGGTTTSTTSSSSNSGPSPTSQNVSLSRNAASTVSYVVKPGDTLEAIGMAQKVPDTQLRQWIEDVRTLNKLNGEGFITEGQKLELPSMSVTPPAANSSTTSSSTTTTTTTTTTNDNSSTSNPPRPPSAPASSTTTIAGAATGNTGTTSQSSSPTTSTSPALQNAPRSMTGCFYVIKAEDDMAGIAKKVGIETGKVDGWIAQVKQMNGVDFKVMPVGTAIQMPC